MTDTDRRPSEIQRPLSNDVVKYYPSKPLELSKKLFLRNVRSAPRGKSPGFSGLRYEHIRAILDCEYVFEEFYQVAQCLALQGIVARRQQPDVARIMASSASLAVRQMHAHCQH